MCGTPVIAFNRGSMKELIVDGKTGFLVNTIEEAILAVEKIASIKRCECRAHAMEKFSSEVMALNYLKLYEQVVRKSNSI
jgi:glycosyltransferase involved in cell wall biosynthesis